MDQHYMCRALELAERGARHVSPNPMVGCVIVKDGRIIGEGWHEQYGGLHAERQAFAHLTESAEGATLYVTLEPCCHWGKTPPCTDAILEHRIARVVVGCLDANPLVAGKGCQILREAGVQVDIGVCEAACRALNEVFFHYICHKTPFIVLKYAMTLDGKIAAATGDSKWITGEQARAHVHETRNRLSAILVGIGTVLADDPLLTCRLEGGCNPIRVICDSRLRIPLSSQIMQTAHEVHTILACTARPPAADALERAGAEILVCQARHGQVDLADLMQRLGTAGIDSILAEGGSALHFSLLEQRLVHKVQAYIAPKLIGGATAKTPIGGAGIPLMRDAVQLQNLTISPLGADYLLEGSLPCLPEL